MTIAQRSKLVKALELVKANLAELRSVEFAPLVDEVVKERLQRDTIHKAIEKSLAGYYSQAGKNREPVELYPCCGAETFGEHLGYAMHDGHGVPV